MNERQIGFIEQAFRETLGIPVPGSVAFCRFLERDVIIAMSTRDSKGLGGWLVYGVGNFSFDGARIISTDQAVEMRESKQDPVLLLVDRKSAGAGMDGIYNSGREIRESVYFKKAHDIVRKSLEWGSKGIAKKAVEKARRLAGRKHLSPVEIFSFYSKCSELKSVGAALGHLGLWPVYDNGKLEDNELDKSAKMVEKLLLSSTIRVPVKNLVDELLLSDSDEKQKSELLDLLKQSSGMPWRQLVEIVSENPDLWLNRLKPGIFDLDNLKGIEIVPWRSKNKQLVSWSGLSFSPDTEIPEFVIDRNALKKKKSSKIEIRWKTSPENLAKGACDYSVEIVSGNETLAEKTISHSEKNPQKITFTTEDFEHIDDDSKFEATVRVKAIGDKEIEQETEDFILRFGLADQKAVSTSANVFRSMIEAAISIDSFQDFEKVVRQHDSTLYYGHDKKGFVTLRCKPKSGKVFCPPLISEIERLWAEREGAVGRWRIKIRSDGERVGDPEFLEIEGDTSNPTWSKFSQTSRKICNTIRTGHGMVGMVYGTEKGFEEYINSWIEAGDFCDPEIGLVGTIEVKSINDETFGLIVLPINPVRMAWHQGYDLLLKYARYDLKMSPSRIRELCRSLDGTHCPAFLPGTDCGNTFIFGDVLNFYFVAMVLDNDREPKASVAMMARALVDGKQFVAQSVAQATAECLGKEVSRYTQLHSNYDTLHIHAFHPGDSMTLGRALGKAIDARAVNSEEDEDLGNSRDLGFVLQLFPAQENRPVLGKFFSSIVESSRSGVGAVASEDRWITEIRNTEGGVRRPKLVWAKRKATDPISTAHLAVAFDTFDSCVKTMKHNEVNFSNTPLEVFGLVLNRQRVFDFLGEPNWKTFLNLELDGEKHPVSRTLTERLFRAHRLALKLTASRIGEINALPYLSTNITREKEEKLAELHRYCDWVITIDRNAGIEYFDSPKEKSDIYDAYIIECVPEREDLGFLQLVTSTSNLGEITGLLDEALATMGVSSSPRNCVFLMNQLKSLSGRFAMRLAEGGNVAQEMVALAYTNAKCAQNEDYDGVWPSLKRGFFVPVDDVPQLLGNQTEDSNHDGTRCDLLYVTASPKGGFQFNFIEIKYRRYLRTARSRDMVDGILRQLRVSRQKWNQMYGDDLPEFTKSINRSNLARILSFYVEKAWRHDLEEEAYEIISKEIKKMLREGSRYSLQRNDEMHRPDRAFVFCPEYLAAAVSEEPSHGNVKIWLFGYNVLNMGQNQNPTYAKKIGATDLNQEIATEKVAQDRHDNQSSKNHKTEGREEPGLNTDVVLGNTDFQDDTVTWTISIRSNPHLMIVGLPGMGKTTCLLNLCLQMVQAGISPIIFSYHEDIDQMLTKHLGDDINFVDYAGLGFNPLEVIGETAHAYVDNVGMIRDIFKAIFPDLGEIQLGALRQSLKKSYTDLGWAEFDGKTNRPPLPRFDSFYEDLLTSEKKESGLITRLSELSDYNFFENTSGANSLLEIQKTSVIRIHQTQNETLQKAFSTFVLFNVYQRMFQRGPTSRMTHAIIFDEAHRAAKLKLIPKMIKECRKFGLAFVLASQEAKDFDGSIYSAIANYLVLRVSENDSKVMAKVLASNEQASTVRDQLKRLPKYKAFFTQEGLSRPKMLALKNI